MTIFWLKLTILIRESAGLMISVFKVKFGLTMLSGQLQDDKKWFHTLFSIEKVEVFLRIRNRYFGEKRGIYCHRKNYSTCSKNTMPFFYLNLNSFSVKKPQFTNYFASVSRST